MASAEPGELIRFSCECGAVLVARVSQAGHKGKCKRCDRVLEIPEPSAATAAKPSEDAVAVEEVCNICQTVVEDDDDITVCDACGLPFHEECWQENLGCSAYGCWNVNALKTGPDIKIESPDQPPRPEGMPQQMFKTRPRPVRPQQVKEPEVQLAPYFTMAACAIAAVFSTVMFGFPSLLTIGMSVAMVRNSGSQLGQAIPITCFVISGLGVLFGLVLSRLFWMA